MSRISIPLEDELGERIAKNIPLGARSMIIRSVLEMAMDLVESHGSGALGLIMNKEIKFVPSGVQNLNKTGQSEEADAERGSS